MNIFISYNSTNYEDVGKIARKLEESGYSIWIDRENISNGMNIFEKIREGISQSDVMIAFITDKYNNSSYAWAEFGAVLLGNSRTKLIAVVIGDAQIPYSFMGIVCRKYKSFNDFIADDLIRDLKSISEGFVDNIKTEDEIKTENENTYIRNLKKSLNSNRLTIVCGAGISVDAGIPSWNTLLLSMLNKCINEEFKFDIDDAKESLPTSSIILGKYLKIMLGKDFENILKDSLYENLYEAESFMGKQALKESALMHSIINLIRPKRNKGSVESVITFNFDSLIEDTLNKYGIENCSIFNEGMAADNTQIPIYHVHGFLPRTIDIKAPNIVFSEDSYHTQFIDPYSWSNLIQLYKYMNNTCLFLGLSITDPNLRRLLDISRRKNNNDSPRHYLIKKMPEIGNSFQRTQIILEEQDANSLGLNIFWVKEYDEIPEIINQIGI